MSIHTFQERTTYIENDEEGYRYSISPFFNNPKIFVLKYFEKSTGQKNEWVQWKNDDISGSKSDLLALARGILIHFGEDK